ncbi:MAG: alpha/beta hydrolase family protein [Thermoplasmatota archaeon]
MHWQPVLAFLVAALALAACAPSADASSGVQCFGSAGAERAAPYEVGEGDRRATGNYAHPRGPPRAIVAVGHGHHATANSLNGSLANLARHGALAVGMEFRGPTDDYKLYAGAEDTIAAVEDLRARCGDLPVILWGLSMGGHISAWAIMQSPHLADYLVMDVGPANIPQFIAATLLSGPSVVDAYEGKGQQALIDTSPALNTTAWRGSGLEWAYLVYGSADTTVTPDQGLQMLANLQAQGVPATYYLVAYRGEPWCDPLTLPEGCTVPPDGIGISPAVHARSAETLVIQLLEGRVMGDDLPPVGLATPEHDPVPDRLPLGPTTGVAALDDLLVEGWETADRQLRALDRRMGPYYLTS